MLAYNGKAFLFTDIERGRETKLDFK